MTVEQLTDGTFEKEVLQWKTPVVVDFYADWCGPCRMMAPFFEELAKEFDGKLKFAKINMDENKTHAGQYGIMSIPCLIIFDNGKEIVRQIGTMNKYSLKNLLTQCVK